MTYEKINQIQDEELRNIFLLLKKLRNSQRKLKQTINNNGNNTNN